MKRSAGLLLAAMSLAGCMGPSAQFTLPTPPATPIYDHAITPTRVGPISLGMAGQDALRILGSPDDSSDSSGTTYANWRQAGFSIGIRDDDHRVCSISVSQAGYATESGVGPGSTQLEMRVGIGNPDFLNYNPGGVWRADYSRYGYAIFGDSNGRITGIYVGIREYCQ